jgi:alcohol dehydrogenase
LSDENIPEKKALIVISAGTSMKKYSYLERLENILADKAFNLFYLIRY